jgi:hypothetical protein
MVRDASDALARRAGVKVEGDGHRHFGDARMLDIAKRTLEMGGVNTSMLSGNEIATRALATSDFSNVMTAVGQKTVRAAYDAIPLVHREVFRKAFANDFKAKHSVLSSAASVLPEVPEGGAIEYAAASTEMASYAIKTYGKIIPITRQCIVNDDFELVASAARQRGRSAAETERKLVWDFVMKNGGAGPDAPDGVACFHANHKNFPAASGTPISATTLAAARAALRAAESPDGYQINATLAHVVVSIAGETDFDQLINGVYMPTAAGASMTERLRKVQIHVEPMISATKKHWYGFADYNQVDTFEYAYLSGTDGPRVEQRLGFAIEGIELKVALDFGVGLIDYRGCYYQREA